MAAAPRTHTHTQYYIRKNEHYILHTHKESARALSSKSPLSLSLYFYIIIKYIIIILLLLHHHHHRLITEIVFVCVCVNTLYSRIKRSIKKDYTHNF